MSIAVIADTEPAEGARLVAVTATSATSGDAIMGGDAGTGSDAGGGGAIGIGIGEGGEMKPAIRSGLRSRTQRTGECRSCATAGGDAFGSGGGTAEVSRAAEQPSINAERGM